MKLYQFLLKLKVNSSTRKTNKYKDEKSILQSHLATERHNLKDLCSKYTVILDSLKNKVGVLLFIPFNA